ncbi:hypothetical protein GOV03_01650 [Candidatus Woesearchaeota archaeon]|nr:hypothetical protein [Candidatus Woesearchaeota archaeon]
MGSDLEKEIRESVATYFIGRARKTYSENPEIERQIIGSAVGLENQINQDIQDSEDFTDLEKAQLLSEESGAHVAGQMFLEAYSMGLNVEWKGGASHYSEMYLQTITYSEEGRLNNSAPLFTCSQMLSDLQRNENIIQTLTKGRVQDTEAIKEAIKGEYKTKESYVRESERHLRNKILLDDLLEDRGGFNTVTFDEELVQLFVNYFVKDIAEDVWGTEE